MNVDFDAPWNRRLKALGRQRRSRVFRRVRLRSAICYSSGVFVSSLFKANGLPEGSPLTDKALAMTYFLTGNPQYHRRNVVSRSCSEWEGVGPTRYGRQEFGRRVGTSWAATRSSENRRFGSRIASVHKASRQSYRVKPHGQLVLVSSRPRGPCTPSLSTSWSWTTL